MNKFTQAINSALALSAVEMKNVRGGGNCGFQPTDPQGKPVGVVECGLDDGDFNTMLSLYGHGKWCCTNCTNQGIRC